jgi:NitT/TauT family transport system ATP-binding protein
VADKAALSADAHVATSGGAGGPRPGAGGADEIEARGIWMEFPTREGGHLVLADVDVTVPAGSFVSVIGPSGCGKSTLLKILSGLLEPTAGEALIGGKPARDAMRRREVGMVFQRPTLLPWRRAAANASLLREIGGGREDGKRGRAAALEMLELVGLTDAADKLPSELSGGMEQRVAIARALALDPQLLLMDEPFGALDAITRERMNNSLLEIWARTAKTVVLVTHGIAEAVFLSDQIYVMRSEPGRIIERLDVDLPRPRTERTVANPRFAEYERHLRSLLVTEADGGDA